MAKLAIFVLVSVLASHYLASPSAANENNLLLTGDTLHKDEQLSNSAATFVMQNDCNLVLYNNSVLYSSGVFVSNTHGQGSDCSLSLNNRGQLLIRAGNGTLIWTSGPMSQIGKYAGVLRPDGQVAVYGPSVWSTPDFGFDTSDAAAVDAQLQATPAVRNVLFSNQTLKSNGKMATRDYTLTMQADCNLVLTKADLGYVWQSDTAFRGKKCVARLSRQGLLSVVNDGGSKTFWTSAAASKEGDYVLIVQINGQAVIYGPAIWSTYSS